MLGRPSISLPRLRALAATALVFTAACTGPGKFVWADDYPAPAESGGYLIQPGDTLSVRVLNQDSISGRMKVRADGKISLPFLNDVDAAGYAPNALALQLQTRLKDFINVPLVTIAVEDRAPVQISVLGEVAHAGIFQLDSSAGILQAIAAASGLTDFAHRDRIYLLRGSPETTRIRFTWRALTRAEGRAASFRLQPGDIIVVE